MNLGSKGWHVIMACRNQKKGKSAVRNIRRSLMKSLNESMAAIAKVELEIVDMVKAPQPRNPRPSKP